MLYNDKVLLALPQHTEFVQTVFKGVGITSTFYSLQYLQMSWTGLEGVSEHINIGFIRNNMQLLFRTSIIANKWLHSYFEACFSQVCNGLHRFNGMRG